MNSETVKKNRIKTNLEPASCWIRFLAVPFGLLLCYGAFEKLLETNMSLSIDHWGTFIAGLLLVAAPFLMNKFLSVVLLGTGVFTIVNLLKPDFQSWMNLVLFIALTILLFQPYRLWLRIPIQLLCLAIIGVCLWCVYQEFYKGIEHFIVTGKLTESFLNNRIKTYLPGDFSYYMAVVFIVLSIRHYSVPKSKQRNSIGQCQNIPQNQNQKNNSDNDLWGY